MSDSLVGKTGRVKSIHIYPVKSCHGIELDEATFAQWGLRVGQLRDRLFMLIEDTDQGKMISQRDKGMQKMAFINPIWDSHTETLTVTAPEMKILELPFNQSTGVRNAIVHGRETRGLDQGDEISNWFTDYLGRDKRENAFRLLRFPAGGIRTTKTEYTDGESVQTAFADGFPYLIASSTSASHIENEAGELLGISRFRPNIIVAGFKPFVEDKIREIRLGARTVLRLPKPCDRCSIIQINQDTGVGGHKKVSGYLGKSRYDIRMGGHIFAENAHIIEGEGELIVKGQQVSVIELRDPDQMAVFGTPKERKAVLKALSIKDTKYYLSHAEIEEGRRILAN